MDDKTKKGWQDDVKIAKDEIPYWSKKWGVSADTIKNAIEATRSHAVSKIEEFLIQNGYLSEEK